MKEVEEEGGGEEEYLRSCLEEQLSLIEIMMLL